MVVDPGPGQWWWNRKEGKVLTERMTDSLESLLIDVKSHDMFFRRIISMIPRDLYKPEEEGTRYCYLNPD